MAVAHWLEDSGVKATWKVVTVLELLASVSSAAAAAGGGVLAEVGVVMVVVELTNGASVKCRIAPNGVLKPNTYGRTCFTRTAP